MKRDFSINVFLKEFLREHDKKEGAVADKAGIRRDAFSRILNCKRVIFADELIPILNAAGVPLEDVVKLCTSSREGEKEGVCITR